MIRVRRKRDRTKSNGVRCRSPKDSLVDEYCSREISSENGKYYLRRAETPLALVVFSDGDVGGPMMLSKS